MHEIYYLSTGKHELCSSDSFRMHQAYYISTALSNLFTLHTENISCTKKRQIFIQLYICTFIKLIIYYDLSNYLMKKICYYISKVLNYFLYDQTISHNRQFKTDNIKEISKYFPNKHSLIYQAFWNLQKWSHHQCRCTPCSCWDFHHSSVQMYYLLTPGLSCTQKRHVMLACK